MSREADIGCAGEALVQQTSAPYREQVATSPTGFAVQRDMKYSLWIIIACKVSVRASDDRSGRYAVELTVAVYLGLSPTLRSRKTRRALMLSAWANGWSFGVRKILDFAKYRRRVLSASNTSLLS